jgi:hypothetical protein
MTSNTEFNAIAELDLDPIKVKLMHKESGEAWSLEKANAVEFEYRRFLQLMKMYPGEQTAPLFDVDTFWHYHILDTMKYAADCEQVFGYFLHHFPYIGLRGEDDEAAHHEAGSRMQELYEATFGEAYIRGHGRETTAWSGAADPQTAAWSGAAVKAAWSGAAVQTAWSGAAGKVPESGATAKTAWSGAAVKAGAPATAWSGAAVKASAPATAWSGAAVKAGGPATAWSGAAVKAGGPATAWSGAAVKAGSPATAWSGAAVKAGAPETAWSGAAGKVPAVSDFYSRRPSLAEAVAA